MIFFLRYFSSSLCYAIQFRFTFAFIQFYLIHGESWIISNQQIITDSLFRQTNRIYFALILLTIVAKCLNTFVAARSLIQYVNLNFLPLTHNLQTAFFILLSPNKSSLSTLWYSDSVIFTGLCLAACVVYAICKCVWIIIDKTAFLYHFWDHVALENLDWLFKFAVL